MLKFGHTKTIPALIEYRSKRTPSSIAIQSPSGQKWTFRELDIAVGRIASTIIQKNKGGRIGIVMKNGPELSFTILGAACAGTAVPLNPVYSESEFSDYFHRLRLDCLIIDEHQSAAKAAAEKMSLTLLGISECEEENVTLRKPKVNSKDVALLLLTSGSTGKPKPVPLTHRNLTVAARQVANSVNLTDRDVCLSMWELHHIGGLVDLLLAPIYSGGRIISTPGIDPEIFFELVEKFQPTWFQAVPTSLHAIATLAEKRRNVVCYGHFRFLRSVAAALPSELKVRVESIFGTPVVETYGMTEASPLITSTSLRTTSVNPGSLGQSCGTDIRILGNGGKVLPVGEVGEIAIRGANVFSGYENAVEENDKRFIDGWFLTGDLGKIDSKGCLFLTGRTKQLINRGGEKINPVEVELALHQYPAVRTAAIFAIDHKTLGEDVAGAVVLHSEKTVSIAELRTFLTERVADFKIPRQFIFLDSLPLTAVGKVDRPEIARLFKRKASEETKTEIGSNKGDLSELEQQLLELWKHELKLSSLNIEDDFFAIGGDSLSGVQLLAAVEEWHGAHMPDTLYNGISTVKEMAIQLEEGVSDNRLNREAQIAPELESAQRVMSAGSIPHLSDVATMKALPDHTDLGEAAPLYWCFNSPDKEYAGLANAWTCSTPIIGLYSGSDGSDRTNQIMANHYFKLIQQRRQNRPFYIGGNCRGARVATRLLTKFEQAGYLPKGAILMEYATSTVFDFSFPLLFLFGDRSDHVPLAEQAPIWKRSMESTNLTQAAHIQGEHGSFFRSDNIRSLESCIQKFLCHETKCHEKSVF